MEQMSVVLNSMKKHETFYSINIEEKIQQPDLLFELPRTPDPTIVEYLANVTDIDGKKYLEQCTSQVRVYAKPNGQWMLQARDLDGNPKSVGGDEFFVRYFGNVAAMQSDPYFNFDLDEVNDYAPCTAVAHVTDHKNGAYSLDFVRSPFAEDDWTNETVGGLLSVSLVYTNGIGRVTRPNKDKWETGGFLFKNFNEWNMTVQPQIRDFVAPVYDLKQYNQVICYGDSLMMNFCGSVGGKHEAPEVTFQMKNIVPQKGNKGYLIRSDTIDEGLEWLETWYGDDLRKAEKGISTALILGSAAWELMSNEGPEPGHNFEDSIRMYRILVERAREMYPNVTVLWKSPQAVHLHLLGEHCMLVIPLKCGNRIRYMSNELVKYLHDEQQKVMASLSVPYLNIWETTYLSPDTHMHDDARHYRMWPNELMMKFFYPQ